LLIGNTPERISDTCGGAEPAFFKYFAAIMLRRFFLLITTIFLFTGAYAQNNVQWPSPEVEQLYRQAKDHLSRGAIDQSVTLFRQAIQMAPQVTLLHRDLAQALNMGKRYEQAYKTVEPMIREGQADELTYQIAATALYGQDEKKKAKNLTEKGIKAFPNSGILYHELARYYELNNDAEYALDALLQGIERDPIYYLNYYEAARLYAATDKPIWAIIYGEIFVNLERHTQRSAEMRKQIIQSYQKIFTVTTAEVPKYGTAITEGEQPTFEAAVMQVMMQLAPVVADGITTDNLIMLRTRFAMDWNAGFAQKYPFSLFSYHDRLLREGEFDAYNQWLFGKAENAASYEAWTRFHQNAIPEFEGWVKTNPYKPGAGEFYNTKDLRSLFLKKKKG
jgi:tetratricopeptide (TPR) repeat protein